MRWIKEFVFGVRKTNFTYGKFSLCEWAGQLLTSNATLNTILFLKLLHFFLLSFEQITAHPVYELLATVNDFLETL